MTKTKRTPRTQTLESDSPYILKMLLYLMVSLLWLYIDVGHYKVPLPIGAFVGILFASHEHFRIDRKIEYALILASMTVGYFLAIGLELKL